MNLPLTRILHSPANWCGLGLGTAALLMSGTGLAAWGGTLGTVGLATLGYGVGFGVGGMWLGFPHKATDAWEGLDFADQGDARTAMGTALSAVKQLVNYNPDKRLPASLQAKVLGLCQQLADLLDQWERSKGQLSLEESFHARHIAISYLPDALKTYLSIPQQFARTKLLGNGKTAEETFSLTLQDLSNKVQLLTEDLAEQDAQAFLNHSEFLHEKFSTKQV